MEVFNPSLYASRPPLSSFNLFFLLGSYKLKDNEGGIKMAKTIMVGGGLGTHCYERERNCNIP